MKFLGLIVVLVLLLLAQTVYEGVMGEWGGWSFRRDAAGDFSFAQRLSQLAWAVLGLAVVAGATYGLLHRGG